MNWRLIALVMLFATSPARGQDSDTFRLIDLNGVNVRWAPGPAGVTQVGWAIVESRTVFADARNCGTMVPVASMLRGSRITETAFHREIREAFAAWQRLTNIQFKQTSPRSAQILIGTQDVPEGRAFTDVSGNKAGDLSRALICLNPAVQWKIGFDGNLSIYDIRYAMMHEIGHAIGLDHPAGGTGIMSFRYRENFREPQIGDRLGATALYGRAGRLAKQGLAPLPAPPVGEEVGEGVGEGSSLRSSALRTAD